MDDLHRLYEHQTMMAIGIYSFLDNLLAHMPNRSDADPGSTTAADCPPLSPDVNTVRFRPSLGDLAGSLMGLNRPDTFRDRYERIRILPRLSTIGSSRATETASTLNAEHDQNSPVTNPSEEPELTKVDVTPGGFPEDIFIYLSAREREEYMCSICYSVLKEPYQCKNDHRFCYGCIYTWSTGPSTGHDGCPVCRCDGLYAKNFDLLDKINKKRTRCTRLGCNWMGLLSDFEKHEHRRYSPLELDVLLSDCSKQLISRPIERPPEPELVVQKASEEVMTLSEQEPPTIDDSPELIEAEHMCAPVEAPVETIDQESQVASPNSLNQLGGNTRHPRTRNQLQRRVNRSNEIRQSPTANMVTPNRLLNRQQSRTRSELSRIARTPVANSTARNAANRPPPQRTCLVNRSDARVTNRMGVSRRSSETSPALSEISHQQRRTSEEYKRVHSSMSHGCCAEARLLPLRATTENHTRESTILNNETDLTHPPSIIPTEIPPSPAYHTARQQIYNLQTDETRQAVDVEAAENVTPRTMNGFSNLTLPAIHPSGSLTTRQSTRPHYDAESTYGNSTVENTLSGAFHDAVSNQERVHQPLEYRRLVPRRPGRVVEQLRETREQLAAMLRLMTLELEERRQHVLAATLENAYRNRYSRDLPAVTNETRPHDEPVDTDRDIIPSSGTDRTDMHDVQNNNLRCSLNVLRNLPTPERRGRTGRLEPLHQLTSRYFREGIYRRPIIQLPTARPRQRSPESHSGAEDDDDSSLSTGTIDTGVTSISTPRSPAHLRPRARERTAVPSVILVTGRRNLGHLLSGLRYPRASMNEWSSDDDDELG